MKKIIQNSNRSGFSMAEVVISVAVLMIMIAGIFLALVGSLNHSMDSRNRIIASELAQEGIELVRNLRDNEGFASSSFPIVGSPIADNCRIDTDFTGRTLQCNGNPNANWQKQLNISGNLYTHNNSGTEATKFSRRIIVEAYGSPTVIGRKITSVVTWNGSYPTGTPTSVNCNVGNKCVYVSAILTAR